jgi:Icc-related predicted phosphoesterase
MMKLYVTSDIHLEFGDLILKNEDNVDVLILGGDILVARDLKSPDEIGDRTNDFLRRVSFQFPHTIMIMGNHEHYRGDFAKSQNIIQQALDDSGITNIYLLEKDCKEINDFLFIGGTLWTDFNQGDPLTLQNASWAMNDFRGVGNSDSIFYKFTPQHALDDHNTMKNYIQHVIDNRREAGRRDAQVVVVGHHSPSRASIHERYRGEDLMNGCFSSDLSEFILDRPEIVLWTHGHTHEDFDYMIGSTRIVCNPRGYDGYEERVNTWKPKLITL